MTTPASIYAINGPMWEVVDASTPGAVLVVDDALPADGTYRVSGMVLFDDNGTPRRSFTTTPWSAQQAIDLKLAQLDSIYQDKLDTGYPCTINGTPDHLQTRNADDKINWITFMLSCQTVKQVSGSGTTPAPLPIRAASNAVYDVTCDEGLTLVSGGQNWLGATMKQSWLLTDAIKATSDAADVQAALDAIDLTAGWP